MKKKLDSKVSKNSSNKGLNFSQELGKYGLLFYNSLFMLVPLSALILFQSEDTERVYIIFIFMS